MKTEELIEILQQHPGKEVLLKYRDSFDDIDYDKEFSVTEGDFIVSERGYYNRSYPAKPIQWDEEKTRERLYKEGYRDDVIEQKIEDTKKDYERRLAEYEKAKKATVSALIIEW